MSEINLKIQEPGTVTIPTWIVESSLSLAEIGGLIVFSALQSGELSQEVFLARLQSQDLQRVSLSLKERGVLDVSMEGQTLSIRLKPDQEKLGSILEEENP